MTRGLDHLVLAGRNLDAQADVYRHLGFTVGRQNRHPWGTLNHIVQMPGTFLELIGLGDGVQTPAAGDPVLPFAGFIERYLDARSGFAMLVLETSDAAAEHARLATLGLAAPSLFRFERTGSTADGTPVRVAFTLAFAHLPAIPAAGFFFCQQHYPENFWAPALQAHANTVTGVAAVTFVCDDVPRAARLLEQFAGSPARRRADGVMAIATARGEIEIASAAEADALYGAGAGLRGDPSGHWAGARFSVADVDRARHCLETGNVPHTLVGGRLVVAANDAHGVALSFGP